MNSNANPEPQPAATPGQETPSTPPSITSSIDELGEHLEEKNAAAAEQPGSGTAPDGEQGA